MLSFTGQLRHQWRLKVNQKWRMNTTTDTLHHLQSLKTKRNRMGLLKCKYKETLIDSTFIVVFMYLRYFFFFFVVLAEAHLIYFSWFSICCSKGFNPILYMKLWFLCTFWISLWHWRKLLCVCMASLSRFTCHYHEMQLTDKYSDWITTISSYITSKSYAYSSHDVWKKP
jgi:hypothetical protein